MIQVWERAFPDLFITSPPPADLAAHFRYPENMLQVQATQFGTYHVTNAQTFYSRSRQWDLPNALPDTPQGGTSATTSDQAAASLGKLRPYYVVMKLPNDTQGSEQFYLFEPFTPVNRQNMVAYIAATSDGYGPGGGSYGKLTTFEFPTGVNIDGPQQVRNIINQDPVVSPQISLLNQQGSHVVFGDLLVVPVEDGFLYVQPVFVESNQGGTVIPELKKVVVVHGQTVTISDSLVNALAASFGEAPPAGPGEPPTGGLTVQQLLNQALRHFAKAEQLLRQGDLAGYQREIDLGQQLVQQAQELAGQKGGGSGTGSPSPSPSPTSSPSPTPSGSPSG
jgi:uncharacterized membrane protein (UPF0182 family)